MPSSCVSSSRPTASITTWFNCTGKISSHLDDLYVYANTAITVAPWRGVGAHRGCHRRAVAANSRARRVRVFVVDRPAALDLHRHPRRGALYCAIGTPQRPNDPEQREEA